ncbi:MAG: hypothetical protein HY518_01065 [Candidatus Aenigmarchaeota archaeon]|nr:hypothetical protein [Candidatus Aenigmarchaeota archaeon]
MAQAPQIVQFLFLPPRVLRPGDIFGEDRAILRNVRPESVQMQLEAMLQSGLQSGDLGAYAEKVSSLYEGQMSNGSVSGAQQIHDTASRVKSAVASYWGVSLDDVAIDVVPAGSMLEAEVSMQRSWEKRAFPYGEERFSVPQLPSASFSDHVNRKVVLADRYVWITANREDVRDVYFTGEGVASFYPLDADILQIIAAYELVNMAVRTRRGEEGNDFLNLITDVSPEKRMGINSIVSAAYACSLPSILPSVGIPVLFRRLKEMASSHVSAMVYAALDTLKQDIGIENVCLFDHLSIVQTAKGPVISGLLYSTHPAFEQKNAAIRSAVKGLRYQVQKTTFGEALFRSPRG